jgi:ring-1,2-phenylacetyl-CoA epoxidase subunit PaaC
MTDERDDHVYLSLAEGHDDGDARWAFGTGFEDPLYGIDTTVPDGVDAAQLSAVCAALGDDALISAQRLAEWCTHAPELEEEVALANIGLDLLGQARMLYARAGQTYGPSGGRPNSTARSEDDYAYQRDAAEFRNVLLAELPNGDFAFSIARLLLLSCWRLALFSRLAGTADPVLAAVAAKGVKELTYHRQYAVEWTVRLGDGTEFSAARMRAGLEQVLPYLDELFAASDVFGIDSAAVREEVMASLRQVCEAAGLPTPSADAAPSSRRGRGGKHTEHLAPLLDELQSVARALPGATW